MFQQNIALPCLIASMATFILICTFIVYRFLWKTEIQNRNSRDKKIVNDYRKEVNSIRNLGPYEDLNSEDSKTGLGGLRRMHLS